VVDHNESFKNISKLKYLAILTVTNENKEDELEAKINMQMIIMWVSIMSDGDKGIVSICRILCLWWCTLIQFSTRGWLVGWLAD
jgi:hypothetical protein